jgi:AbrB family looped-hinge helix DNA binding protein
MMTTTKISSKGQVIIPKSVRTSHQWGVGQELQVIEMGHGILLRPAGDFEPTSFEEVAGCLKRPGKAKSLEEMEKAIALGVRERIP